MILAFLWEYAEIETGAQSYPTIQEICPDECMQIITAHDKYEGNNNSLSFIVKFVHNGNIVIKAQLSGLVWPAANGCDYD